MVIFAHQVKMDSQQPVDGNKSARRNANLVKARQAAAQKRLVKQKETLEKKLEEVREKLGEREDKREDPSVDIGSKDSEMAVPEVVDESPCTPVATNVIESQNLEWISTIPALEKLKMLESTIQSYSPTVDPVG